MRRPANLLLTFLLGAALPARAAEPAPASAHSAQAEAAPAEALAPPPRQVVGYVTEPGNQLPYLQYGPYQAARHRWTAGFVTTLSSIAVAGTGVGVLLVGGYSTDLTEQGQRNAMAAGGVITAVGAAGVAIGATLWHLGRRELGLLERGLPRYDARAVMQPSLALVPGGGASFLAGLGGRF